jgi:hypothetical protein
LLSPQALRWGRFPPGYRLQVRRVGDQMRLFTRRRQGRQGLVAAAPAAMRGSVPLSAAPSRSGVVSGTVAVPASALAAGRRYARAKVAGVYDLWKKGCQSAPI